MRARLSVLRSTCDEPSGLPVISSSDDEGIGFQDPQGSAVAGEAAASRRARPRRRSVPAGISGMEVSRAVEVALGHGDRSGQRRPFRADGYADDGVHR